MVDFKDLNEVISDLGKRIDKLDFLGVSALAPIYLKTINSYYESLNLLKELEKKEVSFKNEI